MHPGDLFGEMGLFDDLGRSAEARALEDCQVLRVSYEVLRNIWEDHPELLWSVVRLLSKRIRATDEALADSFFLDVTGRTAKHLLDMAGDDDRFEIPITQEELAGLVGRIARAGQQGHRQLPEAGLGRTGRQRVPHPQAPGARDPLPLTSRARA